MDVRIASQRESASLPIPPGAKKLYVGFALSDDEALLFVRLYDPRGRFVGEVSFGYQRLPKRLFYSPERTTLNALRHQMMPGDYRLVVDTPRASDVAKGLLLTVDVQVAEDGGPDPSSSLGIPQHEFQFAPAFDPEGRAVDLDRVVQPEQRYYRGDLHGHTTYSDGDLTEEEASQLLVHRGLDFMAMTEHNAAAFGHRSRRTLRIPSFELTLLSGHVNIFGLESSEEMAAYWDDAVVLSGEPAPLVRQARDSASVVSLNHPFLKPWHFTAKGVAAAWIDTLEIINDPTYPESPAANDRAVAFLDFLWRKGYRIFGVGGSDAHNRPERPYDGATLPSVYGDPATYVYCHGLSARAVLAGLREGRCYVARHVELDIDVRADGTSVLPGERVVGSPETIDYAVTIRDFDKPAGRQYAGRMIVNGSCAETFVLTPNAPSWRAAVSSTTLNDVDHAAWWVRVDLADEDGHIAAYVNPVHSGRTTPPDTTIDALIQEFDRSYDQGRPL